MRKRGFEVEVHAFLFCMDAQNTVVMIFGVKFEISPTSCKKPTFKITAIKRKSEHAKISRVQKIYLKKEQSADH
jgi:hypothetical protein